MPLSRSISTLACFLLLHVAAGSALAQGAQQFTQEITIYVDATVTLKIYDGQGVQLLSDLIPFCDEDGPNGDDCPPNWDWSGDLDGDPDDPSSDSNCRSCDWGLDWGDASTDVLYFVFATSGVGTETAYYAYSATTARLQGTFWIPSSSASLASPDINFYVDAQHEVTASTSGQALNFESVFAGDYVMPYDAEAFCDTYSTGVCNDLSKVEFFLARVDYAPGALDPMTLKPFPADMREFTFASEDDARSYDVWAPTWDVPNLELFFPSGKTFIVEGHLDAEGTTFTEADAGQGWSGIVVDAGGDFTADDNTMIKLADVGLRVDGANATAELRDGSQLWHNDDGALVLDGGHLTLDGATAEGATNGAGVTVYDGATATITNNSTLRHNGTGLSVRSASGTTVTGSTIRNNGTGILGDITQSAPGAPVPCLTGCPRSNLTILDSVVEDNTLGGVYAFFSDMGIERTTIRDNGAYGLYASDARIEPFLENFVLGNGAGNGSDGVFAALGGDLFLSPELGAGDNRVANNAGAEVFVAGGGNAFLGDNDSGENAVFDGVHATGLLVDNDSKTLIDANNVYWGAPNGPPQGTIDEPVDSTLPLACDPITPPDPNDPFPCSSSRTSEALAGNKSGDATLRGGLSARIRAARAALAADPAAEDAPDLVRLLGGLHRRADTDAEHPATFGLLRSLRARLNNPNVPPSVRATAEAALETVVVDALVGGRNDEAQTAIQTGRPRVEDPAVVRVLTLAEAALVAKAGDYATASALAQAVAESEPDEGAERGLAVLAAHYADLAAESGDGARNGGAHVAAVTERLRGSEAGGPAEADLAVWPNPLSVSGGSAAATVALALGAAADVRVVVYDVLGRQVAALHRGELTAGSHELVLDGRALPAGVYLVKAEVGARRFVERITLVR